MAFAVVLFSCIDTSAKWLAISGLPVIQIVFMRYAGALFYSSMWYLHREGIDAFRSNAPKRQFLRSGFLFTSTVLNFTALKSLSLSLVVSIQFAQPMVISLIAIPLLGERVGPRRMAAIFVGFLGVLIVVQPWGAAFHPAIFFSLGALILASLYFAMTRLLAGVESSATQQIWANAMATICLAPFAFAVWQWPETPMQWIIVLAIGGFGGGGHIAATIAHRWADASIIAPIIYLQLFLATFWGAVVFASWPTIWTLVGGLIIIGSGLYIWHRERTR